MKGPFDYWFSGGSQRRSGGAPAAQPPAAPASGAPIAGNVSEPPGHVTATSYGTGGNTFMTPDLSQYHGNFDPSKYVYSVPAGGYITAEEANNANSAQNKYRIQDPMANQAMRQYYAELGRLPTVEAGGSAALSALRSQSGYTPRHGESYESMLGHDWGGPWEITDEHPSSTPRTSYGGYG